MGDIIATVGKQKYLDAQNLRYIRGTSKIFEYILSTNTAFIKKAFRHTICKNLEIHHGFVAVNTRYLRQLICNHKDDALEKYIFATKIISI